ncbi:DUF4123 domain-containing protein [Pseudomonas sp. NPDC098747]|uniref:DUF4123 domain-containing protein n=1 Tax=Pseudomonas sp. NPDC098747 TaxID=3364487 RepID=UPI00383B5E7C
MTIPQQWLQAQAQLGRTLYLVLDSYGQLDERAELVNELGAKRYRSLYSGTAAESLASVGPYLFQLGTAQSMSLQALLDAPERHWGWLASSASADLEAVAAHWRARLVMRQPPNQAVYRFHDNRVLGRALAHLSVEERPAYLGALTSVCYWHAEQWMVTDNPAPGSYPLPLDPAWHHPPVPEAITAGVQFDNVRRYLMREHPDSVLALAEDHHLDTWLTEQLVLARTWGWLEVDQMHFLLTQSLHAPGYTPPQSWSPRPNETPSAHFERVEQEVHFWQGHVPV